MSSATFFAGDDGVTLRIRGTEAIPLTPVKSLIGS